MAKRPRLNAKRTRIGSVLTGFLNSFTRTVFNVWFIVMSLICYYLFLNTNSLKTLTDALAKTAALKGLGNWMAQNHNKTVGIFQQILTTMTVAPSAISLSMAVLGTIIVYLLSAADNFLEYLGLSIGICWIARTRSSRIRLFIVLVFLLLYAYGHWGHQLIQQ